MIRTTILLTLFVLIPLVACNSQEKQSKDSTITKDTKTNLETNKELKTEVKTEPKKETSKNSAKVQASYRASRPCSVDSFGEFACSDDHNECEFNRDMDDVACGGKADYCRRTGLGDVACGGLADHCFKDSYREDVACGGLADYCEKSLTGNVACGPKSYFCKKWGMDNPYCSKRQNRK